MIDEKALAKVQDEYANANGKYKDMSIRMIVEAYEAAKAEGQPMKVVKMTERGTLKDTEPHPAAENARQWLLEYVRRHQVHEMPMLQESFASNAIEGNRLAEICSETLRRLMGGEPVSDRYLLGLVWTIRSMEEMSKHPGAD